MGTVQVTTAISFNNGSDNSSQAALAPATVDIVTAGDRHIHTTQTIGTVAETLAKGDVGTVGFAVFHNLDATNFVEVGHDDGGFKSDIKVSPGQWGGPIELSQSAPQAKADTAPVELEYMLVEV